MSARSLFVTGTDTGVGKTVVACTVLRQLVADGQRAVGFKPVASGCIETGDGWRSEDALAHVDADRIDIDYGLRNPYALPLPLEPEIAAREAGVDVELARIVDAHARLRTLHEGVLVEGVGGWLARTTPGSALRRVNSARPVRAPLDVANLVALWGLNPAAAKNSA